MISMRSPLSAMAVLAFAAIAGGCGSGSDSSATETGTVADAPVTVAPNADTESAVTGEASDAPELLQFTSPLVGGGELDATTLASKPTAFWFWSPT